MDVRRMRCLCYGVEIPRCRVYLSPCRRGIRLHVGDECMQADKARRRGDPVSVGVYDQC